MICTLPKYSNAQEFVNPGFEESTSCSPTNCAYEDIDCVNGWWNYVGPREGDESAWRRYSCYSLSSCEGERALRLVGRESAQAYFIATTANPLFGLDPLDRYVVGLKVMPIDVFSQLFVVVMGSHQSTDEDTESADILGTAEVTASIGSCQNVKVYLGQSNSVTDYPYLLITIHHSDPLGFDEPESATIVALIDDVTACKVFDVNIDESDCDQLCVTFNPIVECAIYQCGCGSLRSTWSCLAVIEIDDGSTIYDTTLTYMSYLELCIPRNETGEYQIVLYITDCSGELIYDTIWYSIPPCANYSVTSSVTWTSANVPNSGRFNQLTVESGVTLIVEDDVTLSFCPEGKLIIEPNAELLLYGTLTSACNEGWDGVKVYGNAGFSQYFDFTAGGYHQGSLRGYPGSLIENAWTAVELFGPDPEDTGGRISCNGTTFLNNRFGVKFGPYVSEVSGQPRPYHGSFRNCIFRIDDGYILASQFVMHARLDRVNGVLFYGSDFENLRSLENQYAYFDYGYGIYALNSGFTVSAITAGVSPPYDRSTFTGLGVGVRVLPFLQNKFFMVSQSDFTDCYNGIIVDGVSVGTMTFNKFNLGNLPDPDVINWEQYEGGQVGIVVRRGISGFVLEENVFEVSSGNADHVIGVVADNLGRADNRIRRNDFSGLTLSNHAFGINGASHVTPQVGGLLYLCNKNVSTTDKDFYIPDDETSGYAVNNVNTHQLQIDVLDPISAAGNIFARTGDPDDRDFANYGGYNITYWYYDGDPDQEPIDYVGLSGLIEADENTCPAHYCVPPCPPDVGDIKEIYLTTAPLYDLALFEEKWDTASAYKSIMDDAAMHVLQFYLQDTVTFSNDSLLLWFQYLRNPVGEILRSKYYAHKEDFTTAGQILAAIPNFYDISATEEDDLEYIQDIYDILDARGIENLTSADLEDLEDISFHPGHSAALARGILSFQDYHFGPEYYLPKNEEERIFNPEPVVPDAVQPDIRVFPNPVRGRELYVSVPDDGNILEYVIELTDVAGRLVLSSSLANGLNTLQAPSTDGLYFYQIRNSVNPLTFGSVVVIRH